MLEGVGLGESIRRHVKVKEWTRAGRTVTSLMLLTPIGGEGVDDLQYDHCPNDQQHPEVQARFRLPDPLQH